MPYGITGLERVNKNCTEMHDQQNIKNVEWVGYGQVCNAGLTFALRDGKSRKTVMLTGSRAEIWAGDLRNTISIRLRCDFWIYSIKL